MEKCNYCRLYFLWVFTAVAGTFIMSGLVVTLLPDKNAFDVLIDQSPLVVILALALCAAISYYAGTKIYDNYLGPKLRQKGWNEFSWLRGMGISFLTLLILYFLPIFIVVLTLIIFRP